MRDGPVSRPKPHRRIRHESPKRTGKPTNLALMLQACGSGGRGWSSGRLAILAGHPPLRPESSLGHSYPDGMQDNSPAVGHSAAYSL
jgi:hypothetical protein